jgi:RNA polymerase sigma-70 factor (ECF subfamily)
MDAAIVQGAGRAKGSGVSSDGLTGPPSDGLSDEACLRALAGGSNRSFTVLFERYSDSVYNSAFRRTASWSAAEDIAETVFLELWRQRRRIVACSGSIRPWLLGVAANQSRRWWRDQTRKARAVERLAGREPARGDDLADLVASRVDDERRMADLLAAVRELPEPQQDVLTLWVWEGLGYDEIAVALGLRVGTVKSRLSRARARLQDIEGTATSPRASTVEPPNGAATTRPSDAEQEGLT